MEANIRTTATNKKTRKEIPSGNDAKKRLLRATRATLAGNGKKEMADAADDHLPRVVCSG